MNHAQRFVLTGCASGIGQKMADTLLRRGHRVVATDLRLEILRAEAERLGWPEDRVRLESLDVRQAQEWERVLELAWRELGGVDVLMNIAGYLKPGYVIELDPGEIDRHFDVNIKGVAYGSAAGAKRMVAQGHGHIVNIASIAALLPVPGLAMYSASKFAVRSLSIAMAQELRAKNVYVTAVCPDPVQTPMLDLQKDYEAASLTFSAPRYLTAEEVVAVVLDHVLIRRPVAVTIPAYRAWLAHFGNIAPRLAGWLLPLLQKTGLQKQARYHQNS